MSIEDKLRDRNKFLRHKLNEAEDKITALAGELAVMAGLNAQLTRDNTTLVLKLNSQRAGNSYTPRFECARCGKIRSQRGQAPGVCMYCTRNEKGNGNPRFQKPKIENEPEHQGVYNPTGAASFDT